MKRGQETLMPNTLLEAMEGLTLASDIKLLCFLARHRAYRDHTFSSKQLGVALELDIRTVQAGVIRLVEAGHILSAEGQHWCSNERAKPQHHESKASATPPQIYSHDKAGDAVQDSGNEPLNYRNFRTDELMNNSNNKAQNSTAPVEASPSQESVLETTTPAAVRSDAPALEKVPRRRAAPAEMPEMPADLAALPGLPAAWAEWLTYRKQRRLSTAPATASGMFVKLREFATEGLDPVGVIRNSIAQGYQGLFPAKAHIVRFNPAARTTEEANDRVRNRARELYNASKETRRAVF